MENEQFDTLTRQLSDAGSSRRQALRALAGVFLGGALGGVAARLGLTEVAAAKAKRHVAKPKQKRRSQAERRAQGQLQTEGKRKGKKKRKKPNLKPLCALSDCEDRGGTCCPDQSCAAAGACCPDMYRCDGGTCVDPLEACCPGQKKCDGGACVSVDECCPGKKWCPGDYCIPKEECCPGGIPPLCSECQRIVCQNGSYVCGPNPFVKECPDGSCVSLDTCCPDDQPQCGQCEILDCENGQAVCKENREVCGPGGEPDPETCRCKYCEETCDPVTKMCHSNCPEGHRCEEGQCMRICTNPVKPQLCCVGVGSGQVSCSCYSANAMCYACAFTPGACACLPGQTCCHPVEREWCPQECLAAEICQD